MKIIKLSSGIKYSQFNSKATKTPIVVMNGWSVGIKTMKPFLKRLAASVSDHPIYCIATDSALYDQPNKRSSKVNLFAGTMNHLGIRKAHFVAHSEASVTVAHYAVDNIDKVASIQLIGPAGLTILSSAELKAGLLLKVRQDGWRAVFGPVPINLYMRLLAGGIKQFTLRFRQTKREWRAEPEDHSLCQQLMRLQENDLALNILLYKQDELFRITEVKSELESLNYRGKIIELKGSHDEIIYRPNATVKAVVEHILKAGKK